MQILLSQSNVHCLCNEAPESAFSQAPQEILRLVVFLPHCEKPSSGLTSPFNPHTLLMGMQPMRLSELNATSIQFCFDEMVPVSR